MWIQMLRLTVSELFGLFLHRKWALAKQEEMVESFPVYGQSLPSSDITLCNCNKIVSKVC